MLQDDHNRRRLQILADALDSFYRVKQILKRDIKTLDQEITIKELALFNLMEEMNTPEVKTVSGTVMTRNQAREVKRFEVLDSLISRKGDT